LVDDENRENEGDFVVAAEAMTVEMVNFLTRIGGGYLCVAMTADDCERLDLGPQTGVNTSMRGTAFTVSVDGHPKHGVGTGISARDRAKSIQLLADPCSTVDDFVRPGHINPLRARPGGVLVRTGQTEGSVDLCRLAGLKPAAAIIEIVLENGEMARVPDLERLCAQHALKMCSVEQIIEYRLARETLVKRLEPASGARIDTAEGVFTLIAYESAVDPVPHLVLSHGGIGVPDAHGRIPQFDEAVLVRMHRRDLLGDIFGVTDGGGTKSSSDDLRAAMRAIRAAGRGAIVYLRPEGSGEDFFARLQQIRRPSDDVNSPDLTRTEGVSVRAQPMDSREFGVGGQILRDLGLSRLRVLTNHPRRAMPGLHGFGLEIVEQVGLRS
jgi:3,4-dihydroxy 2-butanone 4-phosphate synthase/GTP cyclohydrolase II